jgi:hypothetical protein
MTITLDIGMKEENSWLFGISVILLVERTVLRKLGHVSYNWLPLYSRHKSFTAPHFIAGVAREIDPTFLGWLQ